MNRLRLVALGALCGAAWGVAARVWMRIIATDPEFTWSGTLFIVAAATISGLGMGVVLASRRRRSARVFGVVTILPLGVGAGMLMLPTIALGSAAMVLRRPVARAVFLVLAVLSAGLLIAPPLVADLPWSRAAIGVVLYLGLVSWMSAMLAVSLRSTRRQPVAPSVGERRSTLVG